MDIGERLRSERERLRMPQAAFAELCGVKKLAQINYESNKRRPDADYLAKAAAAGVDVAYVVTGVRTGPAPAALPARERTLLENYQKTDAEGRRAIERQAMLEAQRGTEIPAKPDRKAA